MKIKKVELHAFRAYESRSNGTFNFINEDENISNFISIYAPNGFGKTSFYDGVEWCMTNEIKRFSKERSDVAFAERQQVSRVTGSREKQYILKNKNVPNEEGIVNLSFNNNININRLIPNIERNGGWDYQFDININNIERKYFKNVLLSQEGIDNFLREDDSQSRFKKFIDYFGNDYDIKNHDKLQRLIKKNNKNIKDLVEDKIVIEKYISTPIDIAIFDNSNNLINELRRKNINIGLISTLFTKDNKKELDDKISEYNLLFTNKIKDYNKNLTGLLEKESEIKNYFDNLYNLQKQEERKISFNKLKENHKKLEYIENQNNNNEKEIENLEKLINLYPFYKKIKDSINSKNISNNDNNLSKIILNKEVSTFESKIKLSKNTLDKANQEKYILDNLISRIPSIYNNVKMLDDKIFYNNKLIKEKEDILKESKINLDNELKEFNQVNSILEAAQQNIFLEIRDDDVFKESITELETLLNKISLKQEKLKDLIKDESLVKGYKTQIKELISIGGSIVNKDSLSSCPLCSKKHDDFNSLNTAIANNPILNDLEKNYFEKKNFLEIEISTIEKNLYIKKNILFETLRIPLNTNKENIKNIESNISKYIQILSTLHNENKSLLEEKIKIKREIDDLTEVEFTRKKYTEIKLLDKAIQEERIILSALEISLTEKMKSINDIDIIINKNIEYIVEQKQNDKYTLIYNYLDQFEELINFEEQSSHHYIILKDKKVEYNKNIKELKQSTKLLTDNLLIFEIKDLEKELNQLNRIIKDLSLKVDSFNSYIKSNFEEINDFDFTMEQLYKLFVVNKVAINRLITNDKEIISRLELLSKYNENLLEYFLFIDKGQELQRVNILLSRKNTLKDILQLDVENLESKIVNDVKLFFYEDVINKIYSKIDPHPEYKSVKFESTFKEGKGNLNIFVDDNQNNLISPSLYYSSAQLNALSLSIFLAKALHAKDEQNNSIDCIFIDDPIQSMDSINILATIDLFRSLVVNHNKQIILSTHDKNFHELLKKKIPSSIFGSKFIKLETFGKAVVDND